MYKRFLAILAIVTTVFAFGVGSAMAERPEDVGPPDPHPGCENGKDNGCEDGIPGDGDGDGEDDDEDEGEGEGGGEPGPQDLCNAIRDLDPNLAPVADACDTVVAALTGGGAEEPPAEEPPAGERPAPCGEFTAIPEIGEQVADGCAQLVGAIPAP